jgi:SAM-dependent methyltransferase
MRVLGTHWGAYEEAFLEPVRSDGRPDRVLDAGCGRGEVLASFKREGVPVDYLGVDLGVGDPSWEFRVTALADLHRLPFSDGAFDKVICTDVLEHVDHPEVVFGELARVLRPGGKLFLAVPFVWHTHQEPFDRYRFSSFVLQMLARDNSLDVERLEPAGGYFSVLRYMLSFPTFIDDWPEPARSLARFQQKMFGKFDGTIGGPLAYLLDHLDRSKKLTLGYFLHAVRQGSGVDASLDDAYRCPECSRGAFLRSDAVWTCTECARTFPVRSGVPDLAPAGSYRPVTRNIHAR